MTDISIVIPTFQRLEMLRQTLDSCIGQQGLPADGYEIVVVDNCPAQSAKAVVVEAASVANVAVRYVAESRRGISHVRNTGLEMARGTLVAFIDDDEVASKEWLYHLIETQRTYGADVVLAPVLCHLEGDGNTPRHEFYRTFYTCSVDAPTGSRLGSGIVDPIWRRTADAYPRLASGNVLLSRSSAVVRSARFDERLALSGGEDTLFFNQLLADGAKIVWCAEAAVCETEPVERQSLRHVATRAFRGGRTAALVPLMLRRKKPLTTLYLMATGAAQVAVHAPLGAWDLLRGSPSWMSHVQSIAAAAGKMGWWPLRRRAAYGQSSQEGVSIHPESRPAILSDSASAVAKRAEEPALSILIPFYNDDPTPLVAAVAKDAVSSGLDVEVVLLDDGSTDRLLAEGVARRIVGLPAPVRLMLAGGNLGRARARNALAAEARAAWLLFLDADMRIPRDFLARHHAAACAGNFDAAFGGYSYEAATSAAGSLHAAITGANEAADAASRSRKGPIAFCTGNLLVRRDVMITVPFDEEFSGWGWEDVEWAVRAAATHRLVHIDNPSGRLPSDSPETLLAKYRSAAANFALILRKHPGLRSMHGARLAAVMARLPARHASRAIFARLAKASRLPLGIRTLALKLWRASWAAEAVRQ